MRKPLALLALTALSACAGLVSNLDSTPTNDLPNAYCSVAPWGKLPERHAWRALSGVAVDNNRRVPRDLASLAVGTKGLDRQ
jgi:hypothetical protein